MAFSARACVYPSHLILGDEFALPVCVWHVVDWQSQVVCAVFKVQSLWLIQKLPSHLGLHLKNLLHKAPAPQKKTRNNCFKLPAHVCVFLIWLIYFSYSIRDCSKPLIYLALLLETMPWSTQHHETLETHRRFHWDIITNLSGCIPWIWAKLGSANSAALKRDIKTLNKPLD